jgi:16S rRNA (guanine527-N7)-methyltransferase
VTTSIEDQLRSGSDNLGLVLSEVQIERLLNFLQMLLKWNKVYNLTALRNPQDMLSHHLLDSLAVINPLKVHIQQSGYDLVGLPVKLLDVGSGAGLPGVVIAICCPDIMVHCIDAVSKKMAFVQQVSSVLGITNLLGIHSRVEDLRSQYSIVTSRAFSSLVDFVSVSTGVLDQNGSWMAMKGKLPVLEMQVLPHDIDMFHVEHLNVPRLDAERCLVWMRKRMASV